MKPTVLVVFGTRPEAIKMSPVVKCLQSRNFHVKVCVTAQHRQMLDQVLNIFDIVPDYDLNIMRQNQNQFEVVSDILLKIKNIVEVAKPDIVLVQGDTTTTFVASLAAFYSKVKIGHIEAGLRTGNKYSPFPEEINRRLTASMADMHFAPTEKAKQNLLRENICEDTIYVTGNTAIDALLMTQKMIAVKKLKSFLPEQIRAIQNKIILVTAHRRESFGGGFESICKALLDIADRNSGIEMVYPVHLNPNVQDPVKRFLTGRKNIHLIEPLDYVSFVELMDKAYIILTDSGGIQEEAPSLKKPVLVLRDVTERIEAVEAKTAKLVGVAREDILRETEILINSSQEYKKMINAENPYGDGKASEYIADVLTKKLKMSM